MVDRLIDWFIDWLIDWLVDWLVDWLIYYFLVYNHNGIDLIVACTEGKLITLITHTLSSAVCATEFRVLKSSSSRFCVVFHGIINDVWCEIYFIVIGNFDNPSAWISPLRGWHLRAEVVMKMMCWFPRFNEIIGLHIGWVCFTQVDASTPFRR